QRGIKDLATEAALGRSHHDHLPAHWTGPTRLAAGLGGRGLGNVHRPQGELGIRERFGLVNRLGYGHSGTALRAAGRLAHGVVRPAELRATTGAFHPDHGSGSLAGYDLLSRSVNSRTVLPSTIWSPVWSTRFWTGMALT